MKYTVESLLPPTLIVAPISGEKFVVPMWLKVPPETTLDDIIWNKIEFGDQIESGPIKEGEYIIQYNVTKKHYICNCQGFFRVKDKNIGCKHIQAYKSRTTK